MNNFNGLTRSQRGARVPKEMDSGWWSMANPRSLHPRVLPIPGYGASPQRGLAKEWKPLPVLLPPICNARCVAGQWLIEAPVHTSACPLPPTSSRRFATDPRQQGLIRRPVVLQTDNLRIAVMPEAHTVPRLGREFVPTLFREVQLPHSCQLVCRISQGQPGHGQSRLPATKKYMISMHPSPISSNITITIKRRYSNKKKEEKRGGIPLKF